MKNNPDNRLQIIIPQNGGNKTNQDLLEDLKAISDEEIMKAGEEIEQSRKETLAQKEKRWEEMRKKGKKYNYEEWKNGLVELKEGDTLDLGYNDIGAEGIREIAENLELKDGVNLDLYGNNIGAEGAREIAEKLKLKEGVTLDLTRNKIGGKGAKAIAENLELKEGVVLDLSYNNIGAEGAVALAENLELKEGVTLNLGRNDIGDEMKQKLKEREKSYHDKGINCKVII